MKKILLVIALIFNSLAIYFYDLNSFHLNKYILILLVTLNFLCAFIFIKILVGNINNLTMIFIIFWYPYLLFPILDFTRPLFEVDLFIHLNNVGLIFVCLGFLITFRKNNKKVNKELILFGALKQKNLAFKKYGLLILVISLCMEMINFLRIGGFEVFRKGKATYISQIGELTLSLPFFDFFVIGLTLFCLPSINKIEYPKANLRNLNVIFLGIVILTCIYFSMISFRTQMLTIFVIIIVAKTYYIEIKTIKFRLVLVAFLLFITLSFIGQNRSLLAQMNSTNYSKLIPELTLSFFEDQETNSYKKNEFNSAADNFDRFIQNPNLLKNEYYFGENFINGVFYFIPRYLYPGGKPEQITTVYRDKYVPERAKYGNDSTTGFSTIVEGYINGNAFGVALYYMMFGLILGWIESLRRKTSSLYFHVFYISLIPVLFTISRRAFAIIYSGTIISVVYLFALLLLIYIYSYKDIRSKKTINKKEVFT